MLAKAGRIEEAIRLLKEGIAKVQRPNASLYLACSELLSITDRVEEGIRLLKEGMTDTSLYMSLCPACGEMLARVGRVEEAINLFRDGIAKVPIENVVAIYRSYSEVLAEVGRVEEAVTLLKGGIANVPQNHVVPLYASCGEMLVQARRAEEAIDLLKDAITKLPPSRDLVAIYQTLSKVLEKAGRIEDVFLLLRQGALQLPDTFQGHRLIDTILQLAAASFDLEILDDPEKALEPRFIGNVAKLLAEVLALQVRKEWKRAAEKASQAREHHPKSANLALQEAFSWLCAEMPDRASEALAKFTGELIEGQNKPIDWLKAFIAVARGDHKSAEKHASSYLGRRLSKAESVTREMLVAIWTEDNNRISGLRVSYYFPTLPPSITKLNRTLNKYDGNEQVSKRSRKGVPAGPPPDTPVIPKQIDLEQISKAIDFGIITFREDEFGAVLKRMPPKWLAHGKWPYKLRKFEGRNSTTLLSSGRRSRSR
jgi:tetratricopeptide (TPR) repeat protein